MSVLAYGKLRGLEKRHLSRLFGPKREEVIGGYTAWSSLIFIFCHMWGYFLERCLCHTKYLDAPAIKSGFENSNSKWN